METISMSRKERRRLEVLSRVGDGSLSLAQASELLGISYRQVKRLWSRYQREGDAGLPHRLRGRSSNRQSDEGLKSQALALYSQQYADYGPTLASECLAQEDGLVVAVSTLRRWLVSAGLWTPARRVRRHRRRRPRRSHRGELVQMDGSHHDWFEGRRGEAVLMVMIDDATGALFARFFENESFASACQVFRAYVERAGLPRALYVDRAGIYRADREPTAEEVLADQQPQTQFGQAMQALDVELILARSAQAKGRVERANGTLQDRLVKALRRAKISDLASGNAYLEERFLPEFNKRFAVLPLKPSDLHRPLSSDLDLARILAVWEDRVVQNDWTVRWRNQHLQLLRCAQAVVGPGERVRVCEQLDGRLRVFAGEQELRWCGARSEPSRRPAPKKRRGPTGSSQGQKPSARHPWRGAGPRSSAAE
jgi:transposase